MMSVVKIADVCTRTREVEFPEECIHCGAKVDSKTIGRVGLQSWFRAPFEEGLTGGGDLVGPPCGYFCNKCGEPVLLGNVKQIDVSGGSVPAEETAWSQMVDELIDAPSNLPEVLVWRALELRKIESGALVRYEGNSGWLSVRLYSVDPGSGTEREWYATAGLGASVKPSTELDALDQAWKDHQRCVKLARRHQKDSRQLMSVLKQG